MQVGEGGGRVQQLRGAQGRAAAVREDVEGAGEVASRGCLRRGVERGRR